MPGTFFLPPSSKESGNHQSRHASRYVRHARVVMHVGIANPRLRGKRSMHSWRMHNLHINVSGKRLMWIFYEFLEDSCLCLPIYVSADSVALSQLQDRPCYPLTHLPLVPHICVNELGRQWFRWWVFACSAPSHYLNQCWLVVNWQPFRNNCSEIWIKIQNLSYKKMHFEMSSVKWRAFCQGEMSQELIPKPK